ncbi:MAG: hypothetical protein U0Q16_02080 [Bryobacteraceae bacterium]
METNRVGIREFREKLATYLLESEEPVAVTRHGDTVGYYIPVRRKRTEADREALLEAVNRMESILASIGMTEDEVIQEFNKRRREQRK